MHLAFAFLLVAASPDSSSYLKQAKASVDAFLEGMRIYELEEGRKIVDSAMYPQWATLPKLLSYETVFEGMFVTDVSGVRGFKRLIDAKVVAEWWEGSSTEGPLLKRCLVVAYPSRRDGKWRVLNFGTGTDITKSIAYCESELGNTRYLKRQFNYRLLGSWYAAAGRLRDAHAAYDVAAELNRKDPSADTPQSEFDVHRDTIMEIIGPDRKKAVPSE